MEYDVGSAEDGISGRMSVGIMWIKRRVCILLSNLRNAVAVIFLFVVYA